MLDTNISSGLLADLSDEQQQLVAGGSSIGDEIRDKLATYYRADNSLLNLNVAQQSGPQGSTNLQQFNHQALAVDTAAFKDLFASLK